MESSDSSRASELPQRENGDGVFSAEPVPEKLLHSITGELIGRLARKHISRPNVARVPDSALTIEQLDAFCDTLISPDPSTARDAFEALVDNGATPDAICLQYLAPAARRLGERWVSDTCAFLEVTLGCARLHGLQRLLHRDFTPAFSNSAVGPKALFSAVPGESHVFGVTMAADFFRRAGWNVELNTSPELEMLCAQASVEAYDLVGLSIGCEAALENGPRTVNRLRELQPNAKIVLGGEMTVRNENLAERIGADAISNDVQNAPILLQRMISEPINH